MAAGGFVLLALLSFGIASIFTNAFGGSPQNTVPAGNIFPEPGFYAGLYDEDDYSYENTDYEAGYQYPEGYEYPSYEEVPMTKEEVKSAIRPYLEVLRDHVELEIDYYDWEQILEALAHDAYYVYRHENFVYWQSYVIAHAENAFLDSEWGIALLPAPETEDEYIENDTSDNDESDGEDTEYNENTENDEDTESETPEGTPTETPSPENTPPANIPQTNQVQIAQISLISNPQNPGAGITVPFVNNQLLIDLFVRDFQLRIALNNPSTFPFDENAMLNWANTITNIYRDNGANSAETRLRNNISDIERAYAAHGQATPQEEPPPPAARFYAVNLDHFTPPGAAYTLPTLSLISRPVRDWFERNFDLVLQHATPPDYLTGNHGPWRVLEAQLNSLSDEDAINLLIARAVEEAHRRGWTSATSEDFR